MKVLGTKIIMVGDNNDGCAPRIHELGYDIHTGRELELMLRRQKPLSVFSELIQNQWDGEPERLGFEPHVQSGDFVKHEAIETWDDKPSANGINIRGRILRLYALKSEAWRIDAYLLLERIASKDQWNAALERLQGSLLGYTDEQNEEWLRKRYQKHAGWACYTLYAVTTSSTLQRIADLGMRAFPTEHPIDIRLLHCFDEIPSRSSVERSGLIRGEYCEMIRFGVKRTFFENGLDRVASEGLSTFSIRDGQNMKDLNQALATDIQIVKPH